MKREIVFRPETNADTIAITEATIAAFAAVEISNHTEQFIIEALRAEKALALSLVAELENALSDMLHFHPWLFQTPP